MFNTVSQRLPGGVEENHDNFIEEFISGGNEAY
jgi:hypothetical protein